MKYNNEYDPKCTRNDVVPFKNIEANDTGRNDQNEKNMNINLKTDYENETNAPFTDSLTELYNHGFFQLSLDRELKRSDRYVTHFTLAIIDIDCFSGYNKRYGYSKGDLVLKDIAEIVKKNIREIDLAARYSGNEFALILIECEFSQAVDVMERIRQDVEVLSKNRTTISIGLADYHALSGNKDILIKRACDALLNAKIEGKNRVNIFREKNYCVAAHTPKILVVDDEPRNIKLLEAILIPFQYEIIKAGSGEDALSIISRIDIDMVLLDIMMPEMDGYEVCRHIKDCEKTRMVPVIMVTALDDLEAKVKGIEAGADDFITKPPNKVELLARVKSLIKVKTLNSSLTSLETVLCSLANTVEAKDKYTRGHTWNVSQLAVKLGEKMGFNRAPGTSR